jgi:rhodanese-related sulfurtransferase
LRAARIAAKRGYTKALAFVGGIPEWRKFNYPMAIDKTWQKIPVKKLAPIAFKSLWDTQKFYVLDVRPLNFKRDTSFITGAHHCPLVHLEERYTAIPKDQSVLITDWAMKQSPIAAKFLIQKGYLIEGVLKGGMERWKAESYPYESRDPDNQAK